ncbi:MAG: hypothetical protein ABFR90_02880 [Planctomycetota bacterium]
MIRKTIDILKMRWPEVTLVVVLHVAMVLLLEDVVVASENMDAQGAPPFWAAFLLGMGMVLFGILWQMIYLGFLKTAAVSGGDPQQPIQLLRSGRPYFWRILLFQIFLGLAVIVLNGIFLNVLGGLIWQERSIEQLPDWFAQICALAGILIVLKPMLLVPAYVMVYDISAFVAFGQMRFFRFGQIGGILKATAIGFGLIGLSLLPSVLMDAEGMERYIVLGLYNTATSLVLLTLAMVVIRWVQQQFDAECIKIGEEENNA